MHALLYVCIQVRKFLRHGGHVDTVYKSAYGWDVGADYAHTRPSDGATPLNYVATWTDVIGLTDAAALVGAAPSSTGLRVGPNPYPDPDPNPSPPLSLSSSTSPNPPPGGAAPRARGGPTPRRWPRPGKQ